MPVPTPAYVVVPASEAERRTKPRQRKRDWKPVINALVAGRHLFMTDDHLNEYNVKYLMLCLSRRGKGERLRSQREEREGRNGRMIWIEKEQHNEVLADTAGNLGEAGQS